jgi:Mg/Co/Ni transporter MgtE
MPFFQGEQEAEMQKEVLKEPTYVEELLTLFRSNLGKEELLEKISDYHESDIADAMEQMTPEERKKLYPLLGEEYIAEILSYTEDAAEYLQEINLENAARVISEMDSDDAVDVLENLDADTKTRIVDLLDDDAEKDVKLILSYEDDEIGSKMTTNFIVIGKNLNIRQATHELIRQAGENDNISTIYVVDENEQYYGAIDLKDLIVARDYQDLDNLIFPSKVVMIQVNIHVVEILRIRKRLIGKQVIHIKRVLRQFYPRLSQYFRLKHKCMHNQILRWMKMSDCVPVAHFFSWKYISVIHRFLDSLIQMIVHIITDDQIRELCDFKTFYFI